MKLLKKMKDGGNESSVTGYWLIECKFLFSIVLLRFHGKSRKVYHNHAFNCISWLIKGNLKELRIQQDNPNRNEVYSYNTSWLPFITRRSHMHIVEPETSDVSWVISFRGPWRSEWNEYNPQSKLHTVLTKGRIVKE